MKNKNILPKISQRKQVAKSQLFAIEQIDLTFSNGVERVYERMEGKGRGSVMIIPMLDNETILLVRELKEEIGFGSKELKSLHTVAMAPAFFSGSMEIFIAKALYPEKLIGDEPEPLEVVEWKIADYRELLAQPDFNEARSIAALMLLVDELRGEKCS